jgi:hypothetical protein
MASFYHIGDEVKPMFAIGIAVEQRTQTRYGGPVKAVLPSPPAKKTKSRRQRMTCGELAEVLRRADAILSPEDRLQIAAGIEEARRRMNNEHLH